MAIFILTLLAYSPVRDAGFIWDDQPGHVTKPELRSLDGLSRIWFEVGATQQYYPLLHTAFWLQHRLWGDHSFGYHLVNVLLHATAACLLVALLRRLSVPEAGLAGLIFALHPVCVESVAWVSEQKNTLSTVLYLSAALAYLRYERSQAKRDYRLATGVFVLALLTKTVTATLPGALLVLAWWQRGRLTWRHDVLPLVPWLVLGAGAGLKTAWIESTLIGAQGADFELGAIERLLLASRVVWFYFGKLLWPANLTFVYPKWTIDAAAAWQYLFPVLTAATLFALWRLRSRTRAPLAAALYFGGTLFPVLGFVNVFPFLYSYVADHFQYVASLGIIALAAGSYGHVTRLLGTSLARGLACGILACLALLSWRQTHMYRDVFTLYTTTLARNPACWMAHTNLGVSLTDAGKPAEALPHYEEALKLRPVYPEAENNFGHALNALARHAEAVPHLERALQLRPDYPEAQNNLGVAFMALGRKSEGMARFEQAIRLAPRYAVAHFNLGLALATGGRTEEAIERFEQAVRLDPNYAEAELNWGIGLALTARAMEGLPHFRRAIELRPDSASMKNSYGRALALLGAYDEAIEQYRMAIQLSPAYAEAHFNLALALQQRGRQAEAAQHYNQALRLGWRN